MTTAILIILTIIIAAMIILGIILLGYHDKKHAHEFDTHNDIKIIRAYSTALCYKTRYKLSEELIDKNFVNYLRRIGATSDDMKMAGLDPAVMEKGIYGTA